MLTRPPVVEKTDNYPVDNSLSSGQNVLQLVHFIRWIVSYPLFEQVEPEQ